MRNFCDGSVDVWIHVSLNVREIRSEGGLRPGLLPGALEAAAGRRRPYTLDLVVAHGRLARPPPLTFSLLPVRPRVHPAQAYAAQFRLKAVRTSIQERGRTSFSFLF